MLVRLLYKVRMAVRRAFSSNNTLLRSFVSLCLCMLLENMFCYPVQVSAKPFVFSFPAGFSLSSLVGVGGATAGGGAGGDARQEGRAGVKPYTGRRVSNDSLRMIYWHDQTVSVAEIGPDKLLLGCELIEVYDDSDRDKLLMELSRINRPLQITFPQMLKFMTQCQQVEAMVSDRASSKSDKEATNGEEEAIVARATLEGSGSSPLSLLSGIIPGTKWCGTGDIARDYHDIGPERRIDRCCRTHDLCPVKVRALTSRYNLTNSAVYSKSHCTCDDLLWTCLKTSNSSAAKLMGNVYFNIAQVPCLQETKSGRKFRKAKNGF